MMVLTGQDSAKGETTKPKDKKYSDAWQCGDKEKEVLAGDKLAYWRQSIMDLRIKNQNSIKM